MSRLGYVIVEWNQSLNPTVQDDYVYDQAEDAKADAEELRAADNRGKAFAVAELTLVDGEEPR